MVLVVLRVGLRGGRNNAAQFRQAGQVNMKAGPTPCVFAFADG